MRFAFGGSLLTSPPLVTSGQRIPRVAQIWLCSELEALGRLLPWGETLGFPEPEWRLLSLHEVMLG